MSTTLTPTAATIQTVEITPLARPSLRRRIAASRAAVWTGRVLLVVVALALWQGLGGATQRARFFASTPVDVFRVLVEMVQTSRFWADAAVSMREAALGFVISAIAGAALGFAFAQFPFAHKVFDPLISALNALPRIALGSVFILYFGLGEGSKVALAVSLVFFVFLINIYQGATSVNEEWSIVMRTMGAGRLQFIHKVVLPSTVPWIIAASRLGISQAIAAVIIGEMLSAQHGLGAQLLTASATYDVARQYAILVVLLVFAMVLNEVLGYAERRTNSWSQGARTS